MSATVIPDDLSELDAAFASSSPIEMIQWLVSAHGLENVCVTSAMTSDVVLIDVASKAVPGIEVVFLDTGFHFPETLATVENVRRRYPVALRVMAAPPGVEDERWRTDPDGCCNQRKVVPLELALSTKKAWISGVRRTDSAVRATTPFVHRDRRGLVKLNPLAAWTDDDLATYAMVNEVPLNPLLDAGYPSIGCAPCTRKPADGEHSRDGRWSGHGKTECGLHL
jgi:phosphoadenosine phosphosulfate reductase